MKMNQRRLTFLVKLPYFIVANERQRSDRKLMLLFGIEDYIDYIIYTSFAFFNGSELKNR